MSRKAIDWGAYLDGSMPEAERAEIEGLLMRDAEARRDLDGFVDFRAALREAVHSEPVPRERLEHMVRSLRAGREQKTSPAHRLALVAACAALVIVAWTAWSNVSRGSTAFVEQRIATTRPDLAAQWVKERTPFDPPAIRLGGLARFEGAHCGTGWACFDYRLKGRTLHLGITPDAGELDRAKTAKIGKETVYVIEGYAWKRGKLVYHLHGADLATLRPLVEAALLEMPVKLALGFAPAERTKFVSRHAAFGTLLRPEIRSNS